MRGILIGVGFSLEMGLNMLSSDFDIRVILTNKDEKTMKFLDKYNYKEKAISIVELPEIINTLYYDYIILSMYSPTVVRQLHDLGVNRGKIIDLTSILIGSMSKMHWLLDYARKNTEYDTLVTGLSYAYYGLDISAFSRPVINMASDSQDLYTGKCIADRILSSRGEQIKKVVINVAPYSFHFDCSKSNESFRSVGYGFIFPEGLHHVLTVKEFHEIFRENFRIEFKNVHYDLNDIMERKINRVETINSERLIIARERAESWNKKRFPETVKENIAILKEYIQLCNRSGAEVYLLILPVSSIYQRYFSVQLMDEFYCILNDIIDNNVIKVIDLFSSSLFDDDDFFDVDHMNNHGAKKSSKILDKILFGQY
jgi:hypothetical protein